MAVSGWLVWENKKKNKQALLFYFIQLLLNCLWSIIFFGLKNPLGASFEIVVLWFFIILTIRSFSKISKIASYLLYPYIIWVSFAGFLTVSVYFLN
jgi:tryptophan-rich sensory protein